VQLHARDPARRLDAEGRPAGVPVVVEELGEDPQAIAALFRFAAVGVEDAQAEVGRRRRRERQDPIGPGAQVAVADPPDRLGRQRKGQRRRVDDQIVVAQRVASGRRGAGRRRSGDR
jgi:hypothetical protein